MKVEGFQLGGTHLNKPVYSSNVKVLREQDLFYMGKKMVINTKLSDNEFLKAIYKAAFEYSKLIGNSYLVIGKNKNSGYFWFQCHFHEKYFMHLLGIASKTLSATEFYDKCDAFNKGLGSGITISDCTPSRNHSRTTVNEKCSCCADMLRIQDAKYMKVGLKDKISQYVDFTYGYGNSATLGFKELGNSSFPITLIPKCIDEFVSKRYKIVFVFQKEISDEKYKGILVEVKKGIFLEICNELPDEIKNMCEI